VDRVPGVATAEALVEALGALTGQRILYPHADQAPPARIEALRGTGATVDAVVAYTNHEPPGAADALARVWPPDAVPLLSGSAVRRLVAHRPGPWPAPVRVTAIGPSTAAALQRAGLPCHGVAEPHTPEALAAETARVLSGSPGRSAQGSG